VELIMPTIEEEKPAKPRPRSRKTADQRNPKGEQKVAARPESDPVSSVMAPIEADPVEIASVETTPVTITAVPAITMEAARDAALSGEVLPPEVRQYAPQTAGAQAIALAYGDYTRKSWAASRFLVERLITVRSIDEAIEIQGEFAKQAYANFLTHSQKICELYGEWAQQWFAPIEKFTTPWTRIGR
jgi:Phasin protein